MAGLLQQPVQLFLVLCWLACSLATVGGKYNKTFVPTAAEY